MIKTCDLEIANICRAIFLFWYDRVKLGLLPILMWVFAFRPLPGKMHRLLDNFHTIIARPVYRVCIEADFTFSIWFYVYCVYVGADTVVTYDALFNLLFSLSFFFLLIPLSHQRFRSPPLLRTTVDRLETLTWNLVSIRGPITFFGNITYFSRGFRSSNISRNGHKSL